MADGARKPVEDIRIGDTVICNPDSGMESVINMFTGSEKTLVVVETQNDCTVLLSPTHLVKTESGLVEAQNLNAAMRILTEGGLCALRFLYTMDNDEQVYSLVLAGNSRSNLISAGGIYVAEQNTALPPTRTTLALNDDCAAIFREFDAINRL